MKRVQDSPDDPNVVTKRARFDANQVDKHPGNVVSLGKLRPTRSARWLGADGYANVYLILKRSRDPDEKYTFNIGKQTSSTATEVEATSNEVITSTSSSPSEASSTLPYPKANMVKVHGTTHRLCLVTADIKRNPDCISLLELMPIKVHSRSKLLAAITALEENRNHRDLLEGQWNRFNECLVHFVTTLEALGAQRVYNNDPVLSKYNVWTLVDMGGCQTSDWHFKFVVALSHFLAVIRKFFTAFVRMVSKENDAYEAVIETLDHLTNRYEVILFHDRVTIVRQIADWVVRQVNQWKAVHEEWKQEHILEHLIPNTQTLSPLIDRLEMAHFILNQSALYLSKVDKAKKTQSGPL